MRNQQPKYLPEIDTTAEVDLAILAELQAATADMESADDTAEAASADLQDLTYSRLVKRELELVIKLRRLAEGKPLEVPEDEKTAGTSQTEVETSRDTLEMQRRRRERNRQAAIDCRRNRRDRERKLKEMLRQLKAVNKSLAEKAARLEQVYLDSLRAMPTQADFQNYLKRHPQLVRDPLVKPVLRTFVREDFPKLPQYIMMALVPAVSVQGGTA